MVKCRCTRTPSEGHFRILGGRCGAMGGKETVFRQLHGLLEKEYRYRVQYTVVDNWGEVLVDIDEVLVSCGLRYCAVEKVGISAPGGL